MDVRYRFSDFELRLNDKEAVVLRGDEVVLTQRQLVTIVCFIAEAGGSWVTLPQIRKAVWGENVVSDTTVRSAISNALAKLKEPLGPISVAAKGGRYSLSASVQILKAVKADLSHRRFSDSDWSGHDLRRVNLNYCQLEARPSEWFDLSDAKLSHATLVGSTLRQVVLARANLDNADLSNLSAISTRLTSASIGEGQLQSVLFNDCSLDDLKACRSRWTGARISSCSARGANFQECFFDEASIRCSDFRDAVFENAVMPWSCWWRSNLGGANFRGAELAWADLRDSNLAAAILVDADLSYAVLSGAALRGADLRGANLKEAVISPEQLATAIRD